MSDSPIPSGSKGKLDTMGKALTSQDLDGHDLPPSPAPSTPRNGRKYALATELVYTESNDQYNASSVPIYQVYTTSYPIYTVSKYAKVNMADPTIVCHLQAKLRHWRRPGV
jgi:hypothetical protein